jgi:hypothetical protein
MILLVIEFFALCPILSEIQFFYEFLNFEIHIHIQLTDPAQFFKLNWMVLSEATGFVQFMYAPPKTKT